MFPEEQSIKNYVLFPEFDFKTGGDTMLEEVSVTQWIYFHKFDGKPR